MSATQRSEWRLKGWDRAKKDALIREDWEALPELAKRPEASGRFHPTTSS